MHSSICTLFEGHYHFGVAALTNSLYKQGYRGAVYAGYKGKLSGWITAATEDLALGWPGSRTLLVGEGLQLHFLPLDTDYHLTNYKPDFMLRLWSDLAVNANSMFYFDPDIVVTTPWSVFEEWVGCGVALCEDVSSPLAGNHPTRVAWRRYFGAKNFTLNFKEAIYANGGFVGAVKADITFLATWKALQEAMAPAIGGLNSSAFSGPIPLPFDPFGKTDQDALNATVEAWPGPISFVGKAGMTFEAGTSLMSHALGHNKPWLRKPLIQMLKGMLPRQADKDYWDSVGGPIVIHPSIKVIYQRLTLKIAVGLGRFYSKQSM